MFLGGIVLCGGKSSRMGQPKPWLPFGAEKLLQRVVRRLRAEVRPVIVVAAPGQELPALPDEVEVARDAIPDQGPLRGLATGLSALAGRCEAAYVAACDYPFLQAAFVRGMGEFLESSDAVVPLIDGRPHPLAGVYRLTVELEATKQLERGRRSLRDCLGVLKVRYVGREELQSIDPHLLSLQNLNTPEEYSQAQLLAGIDG